MPDMPDLTENLRCPLCKRGICATEDRELAFVQLTDKGKVFCRVTIPIDVCTRCGFKSWGDLAESLVEEAVRREYDKLP